MTSCWIVVPTYDERENLRPIVQALLAALLPLTMRRTILIVDDDSPDGTGAIADQLAAEHLAVRVLHRPAKTGLAGAYQAGFALALDGGADVVVQMDADLSHDPADVPRLVAALIDGADVAIGSRYVDGGGTAGWSPARRALSRAGGRYARLMLASSVYDLTGGFKAWRAEALRQLPLDDLRAQGYAFQIELTHLAERARLTVVEVPITFRERIHGRSKMSTGIALEAMWGVPALRLRHRHDHAASRPPEPAVIAPRGVSGPAHLGS